MHLKLITPPSTEPITTDEAKLFLRVDHSDEDNLIDSLIQTSREHVEVYLKRALNTQTWELIFDSFPSEIKIPRPPLQSVDSIVYKDYEGNKTTLNESDYNVDIDKEPGLVVPAYGKGWPSFTPYPSGAVKVTFTAGYDNIPETFTQAIYLLLSHFYEHREVISPQAVNELPFSVQALLYPHRVWFL